MPAFLRSAIFWAAFFAAAMLGGLVMAWEANLLSPYLAGPLRPPITSSELLFTSVIIFLFSLDAGLFFWQRRYGSCPVGVRRATGFATFLGALTILCPACTVVPLAFIGVAFSLAFLNPFLPLLRIIAIVVLLVVTTMLWPGKRNVRR